MFFPFLLLSSDESFQDLINPGCQYGLFLLLFSAVLGYFPIFTFSCKFHILNAIVFRFWALQQGRKLNAWILTTQSSNSLKSKLIHGTRYKELKTLHCLPLSPYICSCTFLSFRYQIFHKRMPPEAVDLVSRLLQYSPNLRCTAVSN